LRRRRFSASLRLMNGGQGWEWGGCGELGVAVHRTYNGNKPKTFCHGENSSPEGTVFWDVTQYGHADVYVVSEERTTSIFKVEE
jgi:hypothetical protein